MNLLRVVKTKLESTSKVTRRQEEVIVKLEEQNAQLRQRVLELEKEVLCRHPLVTINGMLMGDLQDKVMQTTIEASPPK